MSAAQRTRTTYVFELWRAGATGIMETAGSTFLLAIAVVWFEAGFLAKALVAGAGSLGLLVSPVVVSWAGAGRRTVSVSAAWVMGVGGASFGLAAVWLGAPQVLAGWLGPAHGMVRMACRLPQLPVFILGSMVGMAAYSAVIPLLTQMYHENYPEAERGRLFSRTVMIRIAAAAVFSHVAGSALSGHMQWFAVLLLVFGGASGFGAYCVARCPTRAMAPGEGAHMLRALRFVREDALFRRVLVCWMLLGFANLMMLPLRVEYLGNPKYGLALGVGMIALLTGVIPNLVRLVLSPVWGYLFDRTNFFVLRMALNVGFMVGVLGFFMSDTLPGMVAAAAVYGVAHAGGDVAWSLWVTKFAPPERVADYMSVHTFLTGVRGVAAPLIAFYAVGHLTLPVLAGISAGLIAVATLLLWPEVRAGRKARASSALVEEISE
ncbi:MAG: hypothetical protein JXQ71_06575 [Verrucomicrobia bacterium]|nr:hypothetical protein [Verrucomicrobiota bacterium]